MGKILLKSQVTTPVTGLLDFAQAYVSFGGWQDICTNKTVKFNLFLDTETFASNTPLMNFYNSLDQNDSFQIILKDSSILVSTGLNSGSKSYSLIGLSNKQLTVEVTKSYKNVDSLKVNGASLTSSGPNTIGSQAFLSSFGYGGSYFSQGGLWNVEIINNGTTTFKYKGYPAGDTNTAWKDVMGHGGTLDGIPSGPAPTTQTISGLIETKANNFNKLKLFGGGNSTVILLDHTQTNQFVNFSSVDATGSKTIKFYAYTPHGETAYYTSLIFASSITDFIYVSLYWNLSQTVVNISASNGVAWMVGTVLSLPELMYFEIVKTTSAISSCKINGSTISLSMGSYSSKPIVPQYALGKMMDMDSSIYSSGSIFNIEIDGHKWLGTPTGNISSDWVDLVGSSNGTVQGSPGTIANPLGSKRLGGMNKVFLTRYNGELGLEFKNSVIRNSEMNNIIGDVGTNVTVYWNDVDTSTIWVDGLPYYNEFFSSNTWAVRSCNANTLGTICTSIWYHPDPWYGAAIQVNDTGQFAEGDQIALYNPFLNWEYVGNQITSSFIPKDLSISWMNSETAGGPIYKDGSIYKHLFFGVSTAPAKNTIGLATATSLSGPWDVSNNKQPIVFGATDCSGVDASITSVYALGRIFTFDNSLCVVVGSNRGPFLMYFNPSLTSKTYSKLLLNPSNFIGAPGYGMIEKIGDNYHLLVLDVSSAVNKREVQAWKSSNIEGPYTLYQRIYHGDLSPAGTAFDWQLDGPVIFNDGYKIIGLFGGQAETNSWNGGVGNVNRVTCLLDFNPVSETWTLDSKGPVIINPIDWPTGIFGWGTDHVGSTHNFFFDNGELYNSATFKGYAPALLKMKNYHPL